MKPVTLHLHKEAALQEKAAAADLIRDLNKVCPGEIRRGEQSPFSPGSHIVVGNAADDPAVRGFFRDGLIRFTREAAAPGGGCISFFSIDEATEVLVLAGYDPEGTQRAVYDFCLRELGVDPCAFWTGYSPEEKPGFTLAHTHSRPVAAPVVPLRCYFDNDNDELANMAEPYLEIDFSYWREMIDTLVRLGYNALDIHDHLGRAEYVTRSPYLRLRPDYQVNEGLVDKIIDYAHGKGMKIQVSFFLGWQFRAISDEAGHSWTTHKQEWIDTWRYYLEETPIGRADIFLNRPRDQKLDHPYRSSCGEDPAEVFNEAFARMRDLIKKHNPEALIVVDLYSEGMEVFQKGFRPQPPEDFILCWPDNGFGEFREIPESLAPYKAGIYMHAGFWYNHLVQDPYPALLEKSMKAAINRCGMNRYCLVNGQTFRPFLLNLEACASLCRDPRGFHTHEFLRDWIGRYFGTARQGDITELLHLLHQGQRGGQGYVRILSYISEWQEKMQPERVCTGEWEIRREEAEIRLRPLKEGCRKALELQEKVAGRKDFFHDHFTLPFRLLTQLNEILIQMLTIPGSENRIKGSHDLNRSIEEHTLLRLSGDKNPAWDGWYDPSTARPNGGYPQKEIWRNYH